MKSTLKKYERLECYQRAIDLAAEIVPFSKTIRPFRFGEQLSASALSISSNIAEGSYYNNDKDFVRFLRYARGSSAELDSQLLVLTRMGSSEVKLHAWREELDKIQGMLTNLQKSLEQSIERTQRK